jgi:hypothetical protein
VRTVRLRGGLGNQLFGLAFARSLRILTGEPIGLDLSSYAGYRFSHRYALAPLAERIDGLVERDAPFVGHRVTSALLLRLHWPVPGYVPEPRHPVDAGVMLRLARRRGCFDGYWQNEAYILDPQSLTALVRAFVDARSAPPGPVGVVLHYRTYAEENHPVFSRTPNRDYFLDAIARTEAAIGPIGRIELLSDDPDVALGRLGDLGREIAPVSGGGPLDDLRRIMSARALILTNSSFSWWGAFCGRAEVVAYPRRGDLFHYPEPAARFECL